ncbi:MAG: hypothetical protein NC112_08335 [Oxalobacter formigenes]|nr:hypothetical protein [Oxalobacter formigenes]
MHIAKLIAYCREQGIEFCLKNGAVRVRGATDVVEELLPVLRARKKEIIAHLLAQPPCIDNGSADADAAFTETRALLNRLMSRRP